MENFISTLSTVESEYVALLDGDDFWTDENKLQKQVDFLDANKDYSICFHKTEVFFQDNSVEPSIWPVKLKEDSTFEDLKRENYIPANSVVYRWNFKKGQLRKVFPNNIVPGDYYLHLLIAKEGKIRLINKVMSKYRRHENGAWWLTLAQKDMQRLKYGILEINFYDEIEKRLMNGDSFYKDVKKKKVIDLLDTYLRTNSFEKIDELFSKYSEIMCIGFREIMDKWNENNNIKMLLNKH